MLEGDEILETAQETGYRLCVSEDRGPDSAREPKRIFSASWDVCLPRRIFVCLANGELEVHDLMEQTSTNHHIKFRRFLAAHEDSHSEEKIITSHWDRMVTIPNRPNELIFLLGVSRTLHYTSLPANAGGGDDPIPLLSTFSRKQPGYIHGSPVMEICAHSSRITSLATSQHGSILASGDERGCLRLILLQLLDSINLVRSGKGSPPTSLASKLKPTRSTYHPFLPSYNVSKQLHTGPIFSLSWFASTKTAGVEHQVLATGSIDRAVRLWHVTCSVQFGIALHPFMSLDTLSTHLLSLHSYCPDGERIYLSAGTSAGTVHVWRLDYATVTKALEAAAETPRQEAIQDDGTHLLALLQPSDQAIVHLSITQDHPAIDDPPFPLSLSSRKNYYTSPQVLMILSDTKGQVRVYGNSWQRPSAFEDERNPREAPDEEMLRLKRKFREHWDHVKVDRLLTEDESTFLEGFLPIREEIHDTPIVACTFSSPLPSRASEMLVAGHSGMLNIYSLESLWDEYSKHTGRVNFVEELRELNAARASPSQANLSVRLQPVSRQEVQERESGMETSPVSARGESSGRLPTSSNFPVRPPAHNMQSQQGSTLATLFPPPNNHSAPHATGETTRDERVRGLERKAASEKKKADEGVEQEAEEEEEKPRRLSPALLPQPSRKPAGEKPSPRKPPPAAVSSLQESIEGPLARPPSPTPPSAHPARRPVLESSLPPPPPPPHPPSSSSSSSSSALGRTAGSATVAASAVKRVNTTRSSDAFKPQAPPADPAITRPPSRPTRGASPVREGPASAPTTSAELSEEEMRDLVPEKTASPYPANNSLLHPALHSSKVSHARLEHLSAQLEAWERDDMSISTLHTTRSDVRYALQDDHLNPEGARYGNLPIVRHADDEAIGAVVANRRSKLKGRSNIGDGQEKRRQLTEEEQQLLHVPPPHVQLAIQFASKPGTQRHKYNQRYGLHASIDAASQLPEYSLELNASDLFGDISRLDYLAAIDAQSEEMLDHYLFFDRHMNFLPTR